MIGFFKNILYHVQNMKHQKIHKMHNFLKWPLLMLLLLLVGCPSKPVKTNQQLQPVLTEDDKRSGNEWMQMAQKQSSSLKTDYLLNAVGAFIRNNNLEFVQTPMAQLFQIPMTKKQQLRWNLYQAILLTHDEQPEQALALFAKISPVTSVNLLVENDKRLFYFWYSNAYRLSGNYIEAVKNRLLLKPLLISQNQIQKNKDAIWHILNVPTIKYLKLFQSTGTENEILNGWIELAILNKKYSGEPKNLMQAIEVWKNRFKEHPANVVMPTALSTISNVQLIHPLKIGVFLPQTGKLAASAQIIRKGIEAGFYQFNQDPNVELKFYNSNVEDIDELYQSAMEDGIEFIIGPLLKSSITQLIQSNKVTVPLLALNMVDKVPSEETELYQFGLPVENEARQVAEKFWNQHLQKAAVIIPDTSLGERALKSFSEQLERLDGKVTIQRHYLDSHDYSKVVRSLLSIDSSQQRASELRKLLGTSFEFEPRRRQDVEGIFLFANAEDGRRIKPLIDFYYAQDLPIFSTSRIYHGDAPGRRDRDLDRVQFIDIPWLIEKQEKSNATEAQTKTLNKSKLKTIWPEVVIGKNSRLFAFGFDAYHLVEQLSVLKAFTHQYLKGLTGRLYLNSKKQIARDLPWVQFHKDKIKWIGYLDDRLEQEK